MSDKIDEMWRAFEAYQPTADADGHGESWRVMCKERTEDAAREAYYAAPTGSAAAEAALAASWAEAAWAAAEESDTYAQRAIDAIKGEVQP